MLRKERTTIERRSCDGTVCGTIGGECGAALKIQTHSVRVKALASRVGVVFGDFEQSLNAVV